MRQTWGKVLTGVLVFVVAFLPLFVVSPASAAQITNRKLTLKAGATDGGSKPGGNVNHEFSFTIPTSGNVGSIRFQYCTTTEGTCTLPSNMVTTGATLGGESGITGWTVNNTTNGAPYVTKTAASYSGAATVQLNGIVNPDSEGTFFVRISTYTAAALGGTVTDTGVVAASTTKQIVLTGTMPESLIFCTGANIDNNVNGIPDCSTATSGNISFNQLFSPSDTSTATSELAASTNAGTGYVITVNGPTLTSGSNTIPGWTSATASATTRGSSHWGLNLVENTATAAASFPGTSANITAASDGTGLKGQVLAGYNTADQFKFVSGDAVANSGYDGVTNNTLGPTNAQIYTASYAVNVAGNQLAGTYVSTLTYICTPTF